MYKDTCENLSNAANSKIKFLESGIGRYFVASALAGIYVGLGIFLIMTVGGLTKPLGPHFRIFTGISFGIALSLVIMAGSELFTGNNMIMAAGLFNKKVSFKNLAKIWTWSYLGNLVGSIIIGALFVYSASYIKPNKEVGDFIIATTLAKTSVPIVALIVKGILCNLLVCLAVLCHVRMKSESGKLIMIWWCLFAFITSGFEHSVANMSIFSAALLIPGTTVTITPVLYNLFWVTIGNIIGGSLLGIAYAYMGREKNS